MNRRIREPVRSSTRYESEKPARARLADTVDALQTVLNRSDRAASAELDAGTADDLQMLRLLLAVGPLRIGEIARQRGTSVTTTSARLDRLERRDLIKRDRVPDDRRAMVATLTRAGARIATLSSAHRQKLVASMADGFPTEALEQLVRAIADDNGRDR